VLEVTIFETQKQPTGIGVIQSLNTIVTSIGVETMFVPIMDIVRKGMVIGSATNLGRGLGGVLVKRNLKKSSKLSVVNTKVVGTPQTVFTNPIRTIHVRPPMSSINVGGYRSIDAENSKGGHREPSVITHGIPTHRNGHFVK
jgi:hypothetical protein